MAPACTLASSRRSGSLSRSAVAVLSAAATFVAVTADADAYVVKRTTKGDLVHWEVDRVTYTIDPAVDRNVATATSAIETAMGSWSGTASAPEISVAPPEGAPTQPGFDQKNGVFFAEGGYAPAGRALAITVLTYDNGSGRILDADVVFNGAYTFQVLGTRETWADPHAGRSSTTDVVTHDDEEVPAVETYDLHHVIAHELGHSLGMNDEMGQRDALMYRYSAPNDASIRAPAADDIAGLAELYSAQAESRESGCGSATVSPKKPSGGASSVAALGTVGLLLFLVLRARSDRRARLGFVLAATGATVALVPTISGESGAAAYAAADDIEDRSAPREGRAFSSSAKLLGHARARVLSTSTAIERGLFKTSYEIATTSCRASSCPKSGRGATWGGTIGNLTQEVGGYYAPAVGSDVDVSFEKLPNAYRSLTKPLAGRVIEETFAVRVVTKAL